MSKLTSQDRYSLMSGTHLTTEAAISILAAALPHVGEITIGVTEGRIEPQPIPHEVGGVAWMKIQFLDGTARTVAIRPNAYGDDTTPGVLSIAGLEALLFEFRK